MNRFNRICLLISLVWLAISVPVGIYLRPTPPDFSQFYLSGILVANGDWDSLYPIPLPGSPYNAGLNIHSFAKPGWKAQALKHKVIDHTHFILPPPSALLFTPFSLLSYNQAFWIWTSILTACIWGVALVAGRLLRAINQGEPSHWEGVLALLITFSPVSARAIRIANVSPLIAFAVGIVLLDLIQRQQTHLRCALAVTLGAMLKYATLILAPLIVAMRRWRILFWIAGLATAVSLLTLFLAGPETFYEFYYKILPTLSRPATYPGNQSLAGLLGRIYRVPFKSGVTFTLTFARTFTLLLILGLTLSKRSDYWRTPVHVFAAAGLLISWLFIFSPIAWEHWPVFFCPIWGWLLWEIGQPGIRSVFGILSLFLMYFPAGIIQVAGIATYPVVLPEPFNSSQLLGVILLFSLAFWRTAEGSLSVPATAQEVAEVG